MHGNNVYLSSACLAPVQYYAVLAHCPVFIERHDNYLKQTYRNRYLIASASGVMPLTIPVVKPNVPRLGNAVRLMRDVRISTHADWQTLHWRAMEAAYNSSPFFEYYRDDLLPFYQKRWHFLLDFNTEIQAKMIELLDIDTDIRFTDEYVAFPDNATDLREAIHPGKSTGFVAMPYYQVFSQRLGFLPNLSIVDLLFNMGNEAALFV